MKIFSCALAARERLATLAQNLGRQTLEGMAPSLRPALLLDRFGRAEAFMGQWARAPRSVGALCPSGVHLARRMAAMLPPGDGLVVELGAGTGAVTRALRACVAPERLLVLERLPAFCRVLRNRFPELTVIRGAWPIICPQTGPWLPWSPPCPCSACPRPCNRPLWSRCARPRPAAAASSSSPMRSGAVRPWSARAAAAKNAVWSCATCRPPRWSASVLSRGCF